MDAGNMSLLIFMIAWCAFCGVLMIHTFRAATIADREARAKKAEAEAKQAAKERAAAERRANAAVYADNYDDNPYWATGTYDPDRYGQFVRSHSYEERQYIRDAYGDLDTYESNSPG